MFARETEPDVTVSTFNLFMGYEIAIEITFLSLEIFQTLKSERFHHFTPINALFKGPTILSCSLSAATNLIHIRAKDGTRKKISGVALPHVALSLAPSLLLDFLDVDITPDEDTNCQERDKAASCNDHLPLDVTVGLNDSISDGAAHRVAQLYLDVAVNCPRQVLAALGQELLQLLWQDVGPDRACDGEADGRADRAEQAIDGVHDGDLLMRDGGEDGDV